MEDALKILTNNYDLDLNNERVRDAYEFVKNNRDEIRNLEKYYRPTSLKTGSVGAYLWGSLQNYYGDVNKSCSILNNNSLFNTDENCQYQIWTYKNGQLDCKGHSQSSKAYIYVGEDWEGFDLTSIENLSSSGIEYATVLNTIDSKHNILIKMSSVNDLPIVKEEKSIVEVKKENFLIPYYIFFLIFVIIFIKIYHQKIIS